MTSNKANNKIGQVIHYITAIEDVKLKIMKDNSNEQNGTCCDKCFFNDKDCTSMLCMKDDRTDNTEVYFKEIKQQE